MLPYLRLLSTVPFDLVALRDQEDICPSWGPGSGEKERVDSSWRLVLGPCCPPEARTCNRTPTTPTNLPWQPLCLCPSGMWSELEHILIIHITVGTYGTHKAVQSYSKFPVPATAFCIVIQDGACPRGWLRTHVPSQTRLRSPSLLSSQSHSDSKSDVHYFILQKSRSWPLIHKNAASPCSVSEATFLRHLALQTGGSLVSYTQGRLYEKFICCTC